MGPCTRPLTAGGPNAARCSASEKIHTPHSSSSGQGIRISFHTYPHLSFRYKISILTMDSPDLSNIDISKLSDRDKLELQQFINNENQKRRIQQCR